MSTMPVPPRALLWLAAGFAVWFIALVALYALHAIGCAFGWPSGALRLWMVVILVAHVAALFWMWRLLRAPRSGGDDVTGDFLQIAGVWATAAALVSAILVLGPPLVLSACI